MQKGAVLGIESSCDETAAALIGAEGQILAARVLSQSEHLKFGGVVPEIAARAHLRELPRLVHEVLAEAKMTGADLAAVAASCGPGLIGGLIVGSNFAKGVALAHHLPFIAVNHLEAHALTPCLPEISRGELKFPYLLLLISGGHSQWLAVEEVGQYELLGTTIDDAAGEAFDKAAKLLGLGWPGGAELEALAAGGNPEAFALPRPLWGRQGCDFSFSGLKTALAVKAASYPEGALPRPLAADLAASFQKAVADTVADRLAHALVLFRKKYPDSVGRLVISGGVAANKSLRQVLQAAAEKHGFQLFYPPIPLCTDNAVMVAFAGLLRLQRGLTDPLGFKPVPRWPLQSLSREPERDQQGQRAAGSKQ